MDSILHDESLSQPSGTAAEASQPPAIAPAAAEPKRKSAPAPKATGQASMERFIEVPQSTSRRRIEDEISEEDSADDIFDDIGVTEGTSLSKEKDDNKASSDVVVDKEKVVDKKPAGRPPRKKASSTSGSVTVTASKEPRV
ncbi:hypothetical protein BGZ80_002950 [Entomortierella chlamydospora]|uniref:Uncharacterized protein n=1 Tax=Entomortierella chlamydospora TaxID=101097 RepID=A0A9P6MPL4_9FUNG|nr:hypothetical protein BGZ80_002950 [Entomortierella chlamydospora]